MYRCNDIPRRLKHRVITMLNREELDFLDKLGKDALFTTGHKLSYNEILVGLVEFAKEIGLSGERIDSYNTLKTKIVQRVQAVSGKSECK